MTRESLEAPPRGGPREVLDRTDYYVTNVGALLKIESAVLPVRWLAVPEEQLGKDLDLSFEDERDLDGETPVDAMVALFTAMTDQAVADIDVRVDYEAFYVFAMQRQKYQVPGQPPSNVKLPAEMIRQSWARQSQAHIRAMRGGYFGKSDVPYGSDLAKKLEAEVDGVKATVVRGGGLPRKWHLSRVTGTWKVTGYEEEEEE